MPSDRSNTEERLARIEQMFEEYRGAKERRLLQRAIRLWRKAETHKQLMDLEAEPERVH